MAAIADLLSEQDRQRLEELAAQPTPATSLESSVDEPEPQRP